VTSGWFRYGSVFFDPDESLFEDRADDLRGRWAAALSDELQSISRVIGLALALGEVDDSFA